MLQKKVFNECLGDRNSLKMISRNVVYIALISYFDKLVDRHSSSYIIDLSKECIF